MAEKLLYLTNANADISLGTLFYKYLRPATGSAANITVALEKNVARTGYGFSFADEIDLRAGTGTITVKVEVQTAATATCRIRAHRISSTGDVLASTDWTATQSLGTTGTKTFVTGSVNWTGASATDRLRIDYEFVTGDHSASPVIRVGIANASVETPFTNELDISVDAAGGGTTTPAPGTYDYVVAGKEVELTATPDDYTKKFVKWVINSVDVFENPTIVTMDEDIVAVAHFDDADQYDLVVSIEEGIGTTDPDVGTHQYYEQQKVEFTLTPNTETDSAVLVLNGKHAQVGTSISFTMPPANSTVEIYFVPDGVLVERKDDDANPDWEFLALVDDPDVEVPADYLDEKDLQDGVTYSYRILRYEQSASGAWSNVESVLFEEEEEDLEIGEAEGSGLGSASASAFVSTEARVTASGIGSVASFAIVEKTAVASGVGVGLATAVGARVVIASASGVGIGSASSAADVISPPVEAQALGSGVGSSQASALNHVQSMIYGSGVGGTYPDALVKAIADADASGIGSGTVDGIAQVEAKASGAGVGTSRSTAALFVSAKVEASGIGSASASADLTVIGSLAAFGIGNGSAAGDILFVDVRASAAGSGVGSAQATTIVFLEGESAGSGIGSATAVGDLPLVIITLPATDAVSNEARIHGRAIIPKGWWG